MADADDRFRTTEHFTEALRRGMFLLYCQQIVPIVAPKLDYLCLEIFVRFREEEDKLIPPGTFFPALKAQHLTPLLDRWVVHEVLRWSTEKKAARPRWNVPRYNLNLDDATLRDREFRGYVRDQLKAAKFPPNRLWFEITSQQMAESAEASRQAIGNFKALGCPIAVSDFLGSNIIAKTYKDAGVQIVKLSGSVSRNAHRDPAAMARLMAVGDNCRALGLVTIAEFVEERETLAALHQAGINYAQGFGVAVPVPLATVAH